MAGSNVRVVVNRQALGQILHDRRGPVVKTVEKVSEKVVDRAKSLAPVGTGRLRDSIDYELREDAQGVFGVVTYGPEAFYGLFQELGTEKMPAHPFLRPAVDG